MKRPSPPRHDLLIEKDFEIPLRDGVRLKADVFRPKGGGSKPVHSGSLSVRRSHRRRPPQNCLIPTRTIRATVGHYDKADEGCRWECLTCA